MPFWLYLQHFCPYFYEICLSKKQNRAASLTVLNIIKKIANFQQQSQTYYNYLQVPEVYLFQDKSGDVAVYIKMGEDKTRHPRYVSLKGKR